MKFISFTLSLFFCLLFLPAHAQFWDLAVGTGVSGYAGDLRPDFGLQKLNPVGYGWVKFNATPHWGFRFSILKTQVEASDADAPYVWMRNRNLNFVSNITETAALAEFNFFKYITGQKRHNHTPFIFSGLSRFRFDPTAMVDGQKVELRPLGTEGQGLDSFPGRSIYGQYALSIPFGIGYRYNFKGMHSFSFEISGRYALTDYLDDVSLTYPGYTYMSQSRSPLSAQMSDRSEELGLPRNIAGAQRGINSYNDIYWYAGVSYILTLKSGRCFGMEQR
ncbi:MAG: hypothetical protein FJY18_07665 [Bacteroidetes bacterium]|nr:hypothetical protein [Bacteroidota bacterium]